PVLPKHAPHHGRCRHNISFHVATIETSADPNIIHVKCSPRRSGIIPERFVEEPRLDQVTSAPRNHRCRLRLAKLTRVNHFGVTPIPTSRHCCTAKTKGRFR